MAVNSQLLFIFFFKSIISLWVNSYACFYILQRPVHQYITIAVMLVAKALISEYNNYRHSKDTQWSVCRRKLRSSTNVRQRNKSGQHKRCPWIYSYNVPESRSTDNVYSWNVFELLQSNIQCYLATIFDISAVVEST